MGQELVSQGVVEFRRAGFVLLRNVENAQVVCDQFLEQVRDVWPFGDRVVLDNVARVPHKTCQDAVDTNHLSLHFEMGLPIVPVEDKSRVHALLCLHIPPGEHASDVATRLLPIDGLLPNAKDVESRLISYVNKHGAGWGDFNSGRLLVAGQLLDEAGELGYMREHRIAEWFNKDAKNAAQEGLAKELLFFKKRGVDLNAKERNFFLKQGDLLIVDNTRVAHGRKGQRPAEELLQLLYGAKDVTRKEVDALRSQIATHLANARQLS